jgi:hypothetical protein
MADDSNAVSKSAILQSITTEASGFYTTITTVASTFLGASLLFVDKLLTAGATFSLMVLAVSWISLVASIACVARVRFLNLKSGQLALQDDFAGAAAIDIQSGKFSTSAQWCLIVGMAALVVVGLANVNNLRKGKNAVDNPNNPSPEAEQKTIPYGSLKPSTAPVQTPAQTPTQTPVSTPQPMPEPTKATIVMPDIGEKLTIPYGSLKTTSPAPVQTPSQPPSSQQTPLPAPPSTKRRK